MKLPPLNSLRAFESAARNQSFNQAAKELFVSPASISRFIKILENYLGFDLFVRQSSGVQLTNEGRIYFVSISPFFSELERTTNDIINNNQQDELQILAIPAIAETWLVSSLWQFQQHYKSIEIKLGFIDVNADISTYNHNQADVLLCHSDGKHKDSNSYLLQKDYLTLVCCSEMAKKITTIDDIYKFPLLVDQDWVTDWDNWLSGNNISRDNLNFDNSFERYSMVVNACISGAGIMIGHSALIKNYLKMGVLIEPLKPNAKNKNLIETKRIIPEKNFYAVVPKNNHKQSVKKFTTWLTTNSQS